MDLGLGLGFGLENRIGSRVLQRIRDVAPTYVLVPVSKGLLHTRVSQKVTVF